MVGKKLKWIIPLALAGIMAGCATPQIPQRIQSGVSVMNRYTPEYVSEANKALVDTLHPDAERLTGIGVRLEKGVDALDRWANGEVKEAGR